ncbi:MAG: hypothetical protein R3E12_20445, partial [Candidatus Eisenbacteria bacterium]
MAKRVVLASLLLGAIVTGVSGWQRFPPTAENFEIGAFRSCDKATYIASGIIAEMDTVAHGAYSSGAAKSWVRAELSVSEFLLGDPTSDSTLTFVSFRYPGGFYPTTGERYIVFLEPSWDGMWQLVDGNFLTYLVGDSAQVAWPDTSLSLTGMRGLVDARLELRSPVWQDSAANLVLRGRILGPELRSCGTYDGPT